MKPDPWRDRTPTSRPDTKHRCAPIDFFWQTTIFQLANFPYYRQEVPLLLNKCASDTRGKPTYVLRRPRFFGPRYNYPAKHSNAALTDDIVRYEAAGY